MTKQTPSAATRKSAIRLRLITEADRHGGQGEAAAAGAASGRRPEMTTTSRGEPPPDAPCPWGHTPDEHDSVASRYCRATVLGALDRSCMCVPASLPVHRRYSTLITSPNVNDG
jgi:hypothetical protein